MSLASFGYESLPDDADRAAASDVAKRWWDDNAAEYLAGDGGLAGPAGMASGREPTFVWCPEGRTEDDLRLLGDVAGRRVLEIGAGSGQCSRWLTARGAHAVATDVSGAMLAAGRGNRVQCDARALPFADASFDAAFTAFGAIPFVPDAARVHAEVARVLRPGGRWVFAVTHPIRWAFPDDPSERGLTATRSYFDRRPYVERDDGGAVAYAEYHRTFGDHVREVVAAGLAITDVVEPEWPAGAEHTWGGWGPVRGRYLPGTLVVVAHRPA